MAEKALGMLGLAARAGKVASGEFAAEKSVKTGRSGLVLLSAEASANTKKKFYNMCTYYHVTCLEVPADKERLGAAIGRQMRSSLSVEDAGLAAAIRRHLEAGHEAI